VDPKYAQNAPYWAEIFKNDHESMRLSARYGEVQARWNTAKRRRIWAQAAAAAVEPEPEELDDSGSIDWEAVEAFADSLEVELPPPPPPKHEPGDDLEWPGTMAAYRASLGAAPTDAVKPDPLELHSTVPTNAVKPEPVELHSTVPTNAVKPEPSSEFHSTVPTNAVKPEPAESDSSDSSNWEDLEAYADSMLVETPKHEAGDEVEWPGTMAAYRASVEAVVIVVDDD
jgi:hypothetical protein